MGILPATIGEFKEESLDLDGTIWDWSDEQVKMVNVSAKMVTSPRRLSFYQQHGGSNNKHYLVGGWPTPSEKYESQLKRIIPYIMEQ